MKCPGCGKECSSAGTQRYCIYCGHKLTVNSTQTTSPAKRNNSGVMRFRRKADFSQSSLPEVQQDISRQKLNLASLSGCNAAIGSSRGEDTDMPQNKQSRELKNLLNSLNGSKKETKQAKPSIDDEIKDILANDIDDDIDIDLDISSPSESFPSLTLSPDGPLSGNHPRVLSRAASRSLVRQEAIKAAATEKEVEEDDLLDEDEDASIDFSNNGFFAIEDSDDDDQDTSGPIPTASGTFVRDSSGGFKLALESIKSTFASLGQKAHRAITSLKGNTTKKTSRRFSESRENTAESKKENRNRIIAISVVAIAICALVALVVVRGTKSEAQLENSVATNDSNNYELIELPADDSADEQIPEFNPNENDFAMVDFDFAEDEVDPEAANVPMQAAAQPVAMPVEEEVKPEVSNKPTLTEKRQYGKSDNLLLSDTKGETVKLSRSCVMREGPASRFPFVGELKPGSKIEVLSMTDEDWLYEGGVWTKAGQTKRLGPGTQFVEAQKGMTVAAPKGRVISAKNWRYVKAGKNYGYVGPACFK